jgi:hypothetical protein
MPQATNKSLENQRHDDGKPTPSVATRINAKPT